MSSMNVSVLVTLVDKMTAPLRGLKKTLDGFADVGRRLGVIGGLAAGLSLAGPLQQAAAYDAILRGTAITAGKTGGAVEAMIRQTGSSYEAMAAKVGQTSMDIAKTADMLFAAGTLSPETIQKLMPTIGKSATAAGADVLDMGKTVNALAATLKIAPEQMEEAIARLITAGKLGRFELKNMAAEFPELTVQMAKLGVTGMEGVTSLGAMLQTAMLGTDDPKVAANNLKNFLSKIAAPDAIKNFKKELKVDLPGVLVDATRKGINPAEAVIGTLMGKLGSKTKAEVDRILKTGRGKGQTETELAERVKQVLMGTKVGALYGDMQVLDFLVPMMMNLEKYKAMKKEIAGASVDVLNADFASRMRGLTQQMALFGEVGTAAMRRVGIAFASNLPTATRLLGGLLKVVEQMDNDFPGLIDKLLSFSGVVLASGVALGVLSLALAPLGAVMGLLLTKVGAIVAGIAALAAGAAWVWQNWSTVGPQLAALWRDIGAGASTIWQGIRSGEGLNTAIEWFKVQGRALAGAVRDGMKAAADEGPGWWENFMAGSKRNLKSFDFAAGDVMIEMRTALENNARVLGKHFGDFLDAEIARGLQMKAGLAEMARRGNEIVEELLNGMKQKFGELLAWAASIPGRIVAAIGSIDLSNIIKWPSLPSWLGGAAGGGSGSPTGGFNPMTAPAPSGPGFAPPERRASSDSRVGGRIVVSAAAGTTIRSIESDNPAAPLIADRGMVVGRA